MWDEPYITATAAILSGSIAAKVPLVFIRNTNAEAIQRHVTGLGEVEDVFPVLVEKTVAIERREVPMRPTIHGD